MSAGYYAAIGICVTVLGVGLLVSYCNNVYPRDPDRRVVSIFAVAALFGIFLVGAGVKAANAPSDAYYELSFAERLSAVKGELAIRTFGGKRAGSLPEEHLSDQSFEWLLDQGKRLRTNLADAESMLSAFRDAGSDLEYESPERIAAKTAKIETALEEKTGKAFEEALSAMSASELKEYAEYARRRLEKLKELENEVSR